MNKSLHGSGRPVSQLWELTRPTYLPKFGSILLYLFVFSSDYINKLRFYTLQIETQPFLITFGSQDLSRKLQRNKNKTNGHGNLQNHHTKYEQLNFHRFLTFSTFVYICFIICIHMDAISIQYA